MKLVPYNKRHLHHEKQQLHSNIHIMERVTPPFMVAKNKQNIPIFQPKEQIQLKIMNFYDSCKLKKTKLSDWLTYEQDWDENLDSVI